MLKINLFKNKSYKIVAIIFLSIICNNLKGEVILKDSPIHIIQLPINYSKERTALSIEYLKHRHGITQSTPIINPIMVILHFTDGGTIKSIQNYFNSPTIEDSRQINKRVSALNVGSQFLIDHFFVFDSFTFPGLEFIIKVVAVTLLLLFFGEILPKVMATQNNIRFAQDFGFIIQVVYTIFSKPSGLMVKYTN